MLAQVKCPAPHCRNVLKIGMSWLPFPVNASLVISKSIWLQSFMKSLKLLTTEAGYHHYCAHGGAARVPTAH